MKSVVIAILLIYVGLLGAVSLQQAYEMAEPDGIYDRYLILETGVIYTGGLWIGKTINPQINALEGREGENVFIEGNGAILDLQHTELSISYCENRLDIQDCIIINGDVHFRGESELFTATPTGSVSYCTFYNNDDYCFRFMGTGDGIELNNNIFANALETGDEYIYLTGFSGEWLPTGINVGISGQGGYPSIHDNWSWFSNEETNQDSLNHFVVLCDYA